jgi:hypothetical protein
MTLKYPLLAPHDPNGTRLRTLTFTLDAGDSLLPATTVVPVTSADVEIPVVDSDDLTVEVVDMGLISEATTGDIWGINYRLLNGLGRTGEDPAPLIRARIWLASQPDAAAYDQTYRVQIKQL